MKSYVKKMLQKALGFELYLFLFSLFIIKTLRWNKKEGDFIHFIRRIPDGGLVLDVGANIGVMSVWLGRSLPASQILAYEPIPQNIKTLRKVIAHYGLKNVQVIEKAVGNQNGSVEMVMPVLKDVKMQGLSHVKHESITEFNDGATYAAPIIMLDQCEGIKASGLKLTAIKLDVENFEYFVLQGARELISTHHPIIYTELWENDNRTDCFNLIKTFGYKVCVLENNRLIEFVQDRHKTQNFFFIP
jgi:FkbM family methyltransferase